MAKLFLSYSSRDREVAHGLARQLRELGHELVLDVDALAPGDQWREVLLEGLRSADGLVVLISEHSLESQFVISEIGAARAFSRESGKTFIIPVIIGAIPIPAVVQDLFAIEAENLGVDDIALRIDQAIASHQAKMAGRSAREDAQQEQREARREQLEQDASPFVEEALSDLAAREKRNRRLHHAWSIFGILSLIAAASVGVVSLLEIPENLGDSIATTVSYSLKSLVSIGVMIIASKASFSLASENRDEAIRQADRIHAINFGKFYLKAFGGDADSEELRQVFEHWNIGGRTDARRSLPPTSEDTPTGLTPELLKATAEVFKAMGSVQKKVG